MDTPYSRVQIAIMALPESTTSVIYAMYDLFASGPLMLAEVGLLDGCEETTLRHRVNLTPAQCRRRFGAMRRALQFGAAITEAGHSP